MPMIQGIRIQNYRVLKDVTLGSLWYTPDIASLTPMTAVIGKNGVGKSSLFDAFGFLSDCLKFGVEEACDQRGRGGFDRLRSQGSEGGIAFQVCYQGELGAQPITYLLQINKDESGRPYVDGEILFQTDNSESGYSTRGFLLLRGGIGLAWKGESQGHLIKDGEVGGFDFLPAVNLFNRVKELSNRFEEAEIEEALEAVGEDPDLLEIFHKLRGEELEAIELQDNRRLGIATLGALAQHPRIAAFREFVEGWYLSYFTPDAARGLPLAGPQRRLSVHGDNLGNVVQHMEREHPDEFDGILHKIAGRVPGIDKIDTQRSEDGRLLLRFNDRGFEDPFYAQQMSDGTLKLFAYLLLMEDPNPPPFICIEEPENGLYHKLLEILAAEFRTHATGKPDAPQIFITTHQPYFVDALTPEEVWVLEKQEDGFATIRRASDDPIVKAMADEGLPLGSLWYSDYLDRRLPDAL